MPKRWCPAFAALGMGDEAAAYVQTTVERFQNPFLDHRIADIAQNHAAKIERRIRAFLALAREAATPSLADAAPAALPSHSLAVTHDR